MKLVYYDMFIEMLLVDVELYIYSVFDNTISPRIYIYMYMYIYVYVYIYIETQLCIVG